MTREEHIDAVTTCGAQLSQALVAAQVNMAVGTAALLLLVRALIDDAPHDQLPLSMKVLRVILPDLLHDLEPDTDEAPTSDTGEPVH